ncbi:hypothetical protein B7P43_G03449 [Cryptotermes secundus]|uniref:Major facilitator superfamily (MFS) profile domain-containing protein n=1 Tax=Cryptotermes secundus TaxID=105785 RepID=A0A2J7RLU8_9NEOP|nr:uncharacterized protein LOC111871326 [Cryptotermes secundus]PNF41779.1 hypothetical protein B7P43_G03449 [Cryptotermes secundus]
MGRQSTVNEDSNYRVVCDMEVPEGGWGWIVACGLAVMFTVILAPFSVFGLMFDGFLESLGEGTQIVTMISNMTASFSFLLGVVINYILTKYSCRKVGVVGSVIFFTGSFVSAFANSTFLLAFSYGVLQGIGIGLMIPAALTSFNHYFCRRRTFAMGVTQVITGIGSMILPIILQKLIEEYGFRGTQAIISAISLHSLICAALQRPVEMHVKRNKGVAVYKQETGSESHGKPNIRRDSANFEMRVVNGKPDTLRDSRNDTWESPNVGTRIVNGIPETLVESHDKWESPNREMRIINGKAEALKESHDDTWESHNFETRAVNGKPGTLEESQTREAMEDFDSYSLLYQEETITCEMVKGVIVTDDSKTPNSDVTDIHVKSHTRKESHATADVYGNLSLVRESHVDNVNGSNSTVNLNEVIIRCSEVSKQSQIIVMNDEKNQNEFNKDDDDDDDDDDSAERNLLRDDILKVHYPPDSLSTDMGSTVRETRVSMNDLRATVSSLRSRTSSCERRTRTIEEAPMSKYAVNTGEPNIFSRFWSAVVDFLDLRLMLDPVYVNIAIGIAVSFFADVTYCTLFPLVVLKLGFSRADSALCISILSAADIFGRLCVTLIGAFCPRISSRAILLAGAVMSVIGRTVFVFLHDFTAMAALIAYLGFTRSFIHVPMPLVLAEYNIKRFPAAYGLSMVVAGILGLAAGPLVGWIRDVTNSYPVCINAVNIMQLVLCIFPWALEFTISRLRTPSKRENSS